MPEQLTASAVKERTTDCTGRQLNHLLDAFASAFSAGKVDEAEPLIAKRPFFRWYGSNPPGRRVGLEARDRESLKSYFRERRDQNDSLRVADFRFNGNSGGYGNFQFTEIRSADDLAVGTVTRRVKGAAVCFGEKSQLAVVNL